MLNGEGWTRARAPPRPRSQRQESPHTPPQHGEFPSRSASSFSPLEPPSQSGVRCPLPVQVPLAVRRLPVHGLQSPVALIVITHSYVILFRPRMQAPGGQGHRGWGTPLSPWAMRGSCQSTITRSRRMLLSPDVTTLKTQLKVCTCQSRRLVTAVAPGRHSNVPHPELHHHKRACRPMCPRKTAGQ